MTQLEIPIFEAGLYKGLPKKRQFVKLELTPNAEVAIHCIYKEWLETPTGEVLNEMLLSYMRPNNILMNYFNMELPAGVTVGMAILGGINAELLKLDAPPIIEE